MRWWCDCIDIVIALILGAHGWCVDRTSVLTAIACLIDWSHHLPGLAIDRLIDWLWSISLPPNCALATFTVRVTVADKKVQWAVNINVTISSSPEPEPTPVPVPAPTTALPPTSPPSVDLVLSPLPTTPTTPTPTAPIRDTVPPLPGDKDPLSRLLLLVALKEVRATAVAETVAIGNWWNPGDTRATTQTRTRARMSGGVYIERRCVQQW